MSDGQWNFLEEVFLSNSISAALGHSSTYNKVGLTAKQIADQREKLGMALRQELCGVVIRHYTSGSVNHNEHAKHIGEIAKTISDKYATLLNDGRLRFGVAQKALNLYLKFLWCADRISMPPDCPLDRNIIGVLDAPLKSINWTQIVEEAMYRRLIAALRLKAGKEPLAEWELRVWPAKGCSTLSKNNVN